MLHRWEAMANHPDEPTLTLLQDDHRRYACWIRDLLEGAPMTPGEIAKMTADIVHHLRAEECTVLPGLDAESGPGPAAAEALRVYQARMEDCLAWLCEAERLQAVDRALLLKLADALVRHAELENAVLRSWNRADGTRSEHRVATEAAGLATGVLAGAAFGSLAGPVGIAGGAIVGGVVAGAAVIAAHVGTHD